MKYCSECGRPVIRRHLDLEGRERCVCLACDIIHYQNPRIIVGCIVFWQDGVLMCRRANAPAPGQWIVPSGFLECGETLEEGAVRETFEETGVIIDPNTVELSSVMNIRATDQVAITFRVELATKPDITPGPECLEVAFLSAADLPERQLAWRDALGSAPQRMFDELRSHRFSIKLMTSGSNPGAGFRAREYRIASIVDHAGTGA